MIKDNMENDDLKVTRETKTNPAIKAVFYIFGVFCSLLALMAAVGIFNRLFGYDVVTTGKVIEKTKSLVTDQYQLEIEYFIGDAKKTKFVFVEHVPLGIRENSEIKVKYSSKSNNVYFPELESISGDIGMLFSVTTIAVVCFVAPHNSKKALNKFMSLEKRI